ncbi:MAG: helix-turn-helix domain-containing protein [Acidobacteriota bacterium]|nr:helix-turn-helix domain-containing protein [Acidobacteriota bacterium]MDH3528254.1 helix-turn-helix domain-containing protein [Acidobacteriota bacterium]
MKYTEIAPANHFGDLIKCYWTLTGEENPRGDIEPIIPDGCPEFVFNLGPSFRRLYRQKLEIQPTSIVVGQMKSVVKVMPSGSIDLFGVRFRPFGLFPLLRENVETMTGRIESVSSVFGKRGVNLEQRMLGAASDKERITIFEEAFERELCDPVAVSDEIKGALSMIDSDPSGIRIGAAAERLGVSVKKLERRFKREIGLTPKFLARLTRIQRLVAGLDRIPAPSLTEQSYLHGFSDQSHMIREFRSIAGKSPQAFLSDRGEFSEFFVA